MQWDLNSLDELSYQGHALLEIELNNAGNEIIMEKISRSFTANHTPFIFNDIHWWTSEAAKKTPQKSTKLEHKQNNFSTVYASRKSRFALNRTLRVMIVVLSGGQKSSSINFRSLVLLINLHLLWISFCGSSACYHDDAGRFISHCAINYVDRRRQSVSFVWTRQRILEKRHGAASDSALDLFGRCRKSRQHQQDCWYAEPDRKLRNFPGERVS